ncbi:MAG: hypothetical protein WD768_11435 [Phycisphaeraceae bacterium]
MVEKQNINIPLIVTVGIISSVLLFVIIVGLQAWFNNELEDERDIKFAGHTNWKLKDIQLEAQARIDSYRWADQQNQRATIPIDDAIRMTVDKYAQKGQ